MPIVTILSVVTSNTIRKKRQFGFPNQFGQNQGGFNQGFPQFSFPDQFQQQQSQQQQQQPQQQGQDASQTASGAPTRAFLACMANCQATNQYNPVCGSDNQTYMNMERFNCAVRCGASESIIV